MFMPLGPSALAFVKAYLDRGLLKSGIKFFGQSETNEPDLAAIGDAGTGMITALSYAPSLDTPENKKFVTAFQAKYGADRIPDIINLAAYDAMHVVRKMAETVSGTPDGQKEVAAVKGMNSISPRGPV